MSVKNNWKERVQTELNQAVTARASGNEGMARVCARRAVGILLGEYLSRRGITNIGPSATDRIRVFLNLPDISPAFREMLNHFILHVSPDRSLPGNFDLIAESEWLVANLINE